MKYKKSVLPNGIRVIVVPKNDNPSVTVMVAAESGSNYESKKENGLSHFLEHMVFKGTPSRPSPLAVSLELDSIGAESNAFTSNESTAYYAKSERKHWRKLLEVVSDIYLNPIFSEDDLEKERGVIVQEIAMYKDLPHRHVWDVLSSLLYGDSPAGRGIAGTVENVKGFSRKDFLLHHRKHHGASNTIVVVSGNVSPQEVLMEVKRLFKAALDSKKPKKERVREKQSAPGLALERKKSDQVHVAMAFRAYGAKDKRTIATSLLMGILGDGSSSRLFQRLREKMGACYYIRSGYDAYTDHGYAYIGTGIEKKRLVEAVSVVIDECRKLALEEVSEKELQKAKDYMASHMYMSLETSDALANHYLSDEVALGKCREPKEIEEEIRKVSVKDIKRSAQALFKDERLNVAVVGDIVSDKAVKKALTFK